MPFANRDPLDDAAQCSLRACNSPPITVRGSVHGPAGQDKPGRFGRAFLLIVAMLSEPELRERVSALGRSLESLLFELRLDALQTAVATELEDRQATRRR